jgi:hypothetical protein
MDITISNPKQINLIKLNVELENDLVSKGIDILSDGTLVIHNVADETKVMQIYNLHNPALFIKTQEVFTIPLVTPDFIVQSPKPKTDPMLALAEAERADKSIALIVLDLMVYLEDIEKRLKKAKI